VTQPIAPPPAAPDRGAASDLIASLRDRAPRVAMTIAAGQMAWPVAKNLRARARDRTTYAVKVPGSDDVYGELHEWVLGLLAPKEQRALVAWSSKRYQEVALPGERPVTPALRLRYDGAREQVITAARRARAHAAADAGRADPHPRDATAGLLLPARCHAARHQRHPRPGLMEPYRPFAWPRAVAPPGSAGFESSAVRWLLTLIPEGLAADRVFTDYPATLLHGARWQLVARYTATRDAYRTLRTDMGERVPPHGIDALLIVYRDEGIRLEATARALDLVRRAMRGEVFDPRSEASSLPWFPPPFWTG
jgi:hypothetical protein